MEGNPNNIHDGKLEIKFSRDQYAFGSSSAKTPAEVIDDSIAEADDANNYVAELHHLYRDDALYVLVDYVRHRIDGTYGPALRIGDAFLDGALVEIDIISKFAPYLKPRMEKAMFRRVKGLRKSIFAHEQTDRFITDEQERRFVEAFMKPSESGTAKHLDRNVLPPDEGMLIYTIGAARYENIAQIAALREGYMLMREHATRANAADFSMLERRVLMVPTEMSDDDLNDELRHLIDGDS